MGVAQILIGISNKNPESDIGVKAERSEKQSSQPLESSYLYQCSDLRGDPVSTNPQTD